MKILAFDLGKSKTVACDFDQDSGEHEFESVSSNMKAIHDLVVERDPDRVVFEICSSAGWVHDLVMALDVEVQVANPNHEGWRWRQVKRKTDRLDALKLARLSAMNQLPLVHVPADGVRQWRSLINYRQQLVKRRTQIKNHIRAILEREGLKMPAGKSGWSKRSLTGLQEMVRPLAAASATELWRGELGVELEALGSVEGFLEQVESKLNALAAEDERVRLLQTIPGVGPRLAETVVAVIDDPGRFKRGKEVASYAGLTPRQYQSGSMDRQGGISGQGNKLLRSLLVEVSWLGLRHNSWMREVYERTLAGSSSRKKIAIVAVARRLLIRCWAMLRDGSSWNVAGNRPVSQAA